MNKHAYLVITDLHASYKGKDNRKNYLSEVDHVISQVIDLIYNYSEKGYDVSLLFLGDIVDNSFKNQTSAIQFNNLFVKLRQYVSGIYSVVGNHEMSYYKDNPFWTLMRDIESENIRLQLRSGWNARGTLDLVSIPDKLEIGNTVIYFNHHPCSIIKPSEGKFNIGLFHKDIMTKTQAEEMKIKNGLNVYDSKTAYVEENPHLLSGYNLCFLGHNHKLYGKKNYRGIDMVYLASLGRPNHTEVSDSFLERNIPALVFDENQNFIGYEDNLFDLMSRSESIKEEIIQKQQEIYEFKKDKKKLLDYRAIDDEPLTNIKLILEENNSYLELELLDNYLDSKKDSNRQFIVEFLERIKYE